MRAKTQPRLCKCKVSPEPSLLSFTKRALEKNHITIYLLEHVFLKNDCVYVLQASGI